MQFRGYLRDDGLWDIEAQLTDTKAHPFPMAERGLLQPGTPVHGMAIRLTVDETFTIRAVATDMPFTPFGECRQGEDPMQGMVGVRLGPGWRQAIEKVLGGARGCTHLRELLFNMATAAFQTIFPHREQQRHRAGGKAADVKEPPYHLGRCIGWDVDGPVVQRIYPQFAGMHPLKRRSIPKH